MCTGGMSKRCTIPASRKASRAQAAYRIAAMAHASRPANCNWLRQLVCWCVLGGQPIYLSSEK